MNDDIWQIRPVKPRPPGEHDDLLGMFAVTRGTPDIRPAMGQINSTWSSGGGTFQMTGHNAMSIEEIRSGRVLIFATSEEAGAELAIHQRAYDACQEAKRRAEARAKVERLAAAKKRLGIS